MLISVQKYRNNTIINCFIAQNLGNKAKPRDRVTTRDDYVDKDMFDQDEAFAAAIKKRKFLLNRLLEDQGRFLSSDDDQ